MGFNFTGTSTTAAHQHSPLASDGGVLSLSVTRINGFSPIALTVAMG